MSRADGGGRAGWGKSRGKSDYWLSKCVVSGGEEGRPDVPTRPTPALRKPYESRTEPVQLP